MGSSPKKVIDEIGVDISKIKWRDSGIPMFNVTHMTEKSNMKIINQRSPTFHPYIMDYNYFDIFNPAK